MAEREVIVLDEENKVDGKETLRAPVAGDTYKMPRSVSITGTLAASGAVTGSNLNITNWDTAYGWGDHSTAGYVTTAGAFSADAQTQITPSTAIVLDEATGNEIALDISYQVNKATSGNDTGLRVNQTDTASPGTSLLADFQVGGVSKASIDNAGNAVLAGDIELRDSTNPKTAEIYKTYTDGSNYARLSVGYGALNGVVHEKAGTGGNATLFFGGINGTSKNGFQSQYDANALLFYKNSSLAYAKANNLTWQVQSGVQWAWSASAVDAGVVADTGLARDSAGVVKVTNGSTGQGSLKAKDLECAQAYTVATLPSGTVGQIARITDGDAALAWGATAVNSGAGATPYLCFFNGTNWTVMGK